MLQKLRKLMKNDKGFTLIELVVVVVILGILAAVAIPRFVDRTDDALAARIEADIEALQNAVDLYNADNVTDITTSTNASIDATLKSQLVTNYLTDLPKDPDATYKEDGTVDTNPDGKLYTITSGLVEYK